MCSRVEWFHKLRAIRCLVGMQDDAALDLVNRLADLAAELHDAAALHQVIDLLTTYVQRDLSAENEVHAYYSLGTAWASLKDEEAIDGKDEQWEDERLFNCTLCLRTALQRSARTSVSPMLLCSLLTNLGNQLDESGRFVEAIEYLERALLHDRSFAMAIGNKGMILWRYAKMLYDDAHQVAFAAHAQRCLALSVELGAPPHAEPSFSRLAAHIESRLPRPIAHAQQILAERPLGGATDEAHYRAWCLSNKLFLNPLNDLGPHSFAADDILCLPPIVMPVGEGPGFQGLFNQLKQEFVSARYLLYEACTRTAADVHYSDRLTYLANTLDYPSYSLCTEKARMAYRMAYSLLDKMGFFINAYFTLGIPEKKINFRTLWYAKGAVGSGIRSELRESISVPLRALFWLAKDVFTEDAGFRMSLDPEARELNTLRNELEHKYLKLTWEDNGMVGRTSSLSSVTHDPLAYYMHQDDFHAKTIRLLKMVRAAFIYLTAATHAEERRRGMSRSEDISIPQMHISLFDDEWKR